MKALNKIYIIVLALLSIVDSSNCSEVVEQKKSSEINSITSRLEKVHNNALQLSQNEKLLKESNDFADITNEYRFALKAAMDHYEANREDLRTRAFLHILELAKNAIMLNNKDTLKIFKPLHEAFIKVIGLNKDLFFKWFLEGINSEIDKNLMDESLREEEEIEFVTLLDLAIAKNLPDAALALIKFGAKPSMHTRDLLKYIKNDSLRDAIEKLGFI